MNLRHLSLLVVFLPFVLVSCTTLDSDPSGEWRMVDLEFQLGFRGSVDSANTEAAWNYYMKELVNQKDSNDYQSLSPEQKEAVKDRIKKSLGSIGREAYEKMAEEAFISFADDKTFSLYIFPYYLEGTWKQEGSDVQGEISGIMSVLSADQLPKNYSKQIKFNFLNLEDRKAFIIHSDNFPSFWNLDTLYVSKLEKRTAYRLPDKNQWRFKEKKPKEILKNHLSYLAAIFQDGLDTGKNSVYVNSDCHCSPIKFYGNGISIKNKDNVELQCWKALFENEKDFLEAYEKLIEVFQNNGKIIKQGYENEFERNLNFLNAMVQSI